MPGVGFQVSGAGDQKLAARDWGLAKNRERYADGTLSKAIGKEGGQSKIQNLKSKTAPRYSAEGHAGRKRIIQNPKSKIQNDQT